MGSGFLVLHNRMGFVTGIYIIYVMLCVYSWIGHYKYIFLGVLSIVSDVVNYYYCYNLEMRVCW